MWYRFLKTLLVLSLILLSFQVISSGGIIFAQKPADIFNDNLKDIPSDVNPEIKSKPIANETDNQPPCPKGTELVDEKCIPNSIPVADAGKPQTVNSGDNETDNQPHVQNGT